MTLDRVQTESRQSPDRVQIEIKRDRAREIEHKRDQKRWSTLKRDRKEIEHPTPHTNARGSRVSPGYTSARDSRDPGDSRVSPGYTSARDSRDPGD